MYVLLLDQIGMSYVCPFFILWLTFSRLIQCYCGLPQTNREELERFDICGNMAMCSHNPEYVRGCVNKAFLICLLFYGIKCNTHLSDFVTVSETGAGQGGCH